LLKKLKVFIHIGSTKTGSSAIQKLLSDNENKLLNSGIFYPSVGRYSSAHHLLFACLHPSAHGLHPEFFVDVQDRLVLFREMIQEIISVAQFHNCHTILLSTEYLWGQFNNNVYTEILDSFLNHEIHLLASLRKPHDWLASSYIQGVKYGVFEDFLQWSDRKIFSKDFGFDFFNVLNEWSSRIGVDRVHIDSYEECIASGNLLSGMFCSEVFSGHVDLVFDPKLQINHSPGKEGLELLLALNKSNMEHVPKRALSHMILNKFPKKNIGDSNMFEGFNFSPRVSDLAKSFQKSLIENNFTLPLSIVEAEWICP